MPDLRLHGLPIAYETVGDGFPLLLLPGPDGTATLWDQHVPLLAELCRAITYVVPATPPQDLALLHALLDTLALERLYLACHAHAWPLAVQYARHHASQLEGLVFLGTAAAELLPENLSELALLTTSCHAIIVPALVLLAEQDVAALRQAEVLSAYFLRSTRVVLSRAETTTPAGTSALPFGHAIMRFLLHCERQRNLVRGASFLL